MTIAVIPLAWTMWMAWMLMPGQHGAPENVRVFMGGNRRGADGRPSRHHMAR